MSRKNRRISKKIDKKAQSIKKAIKEIKMPLEDVFAEIEKNKESYLNRKSGGTVKKMNMGGVLKNRGGMFKGTY